MDKVAYVENKIARVIGDFDRAKKLASEVVSSVGEELLSSFQFLAQLQNVSRIESFDSA